MLPGVLGIEHEMAHKEESKNDIHGCLLYCLLLVLLFGVQFDGGNMLTASLLQGYL